MKQMTKNQLRLFIIANITAKQGFTINIKGETPKAGYMSGFNSEELIGDNLTQEDVDNWVDNNYDKLVSNPESFVGGWVDGQTYYLESSQNILDKREVLEFAQKFKQKAIWDVTKNSAIFLG